MPGPHTPQQQRQGNHPLFSLSQASGARSETGIALLITLIALSLFSLLGCYMAFNATMEVRISDNLETRVQAKYAAQSGLSHSYAMLRGLRFNDLLVGPDGLYQHTESYLAQASTYGFRNPVNWTTARSMNIFDPSASLSGLADDGIISSGKQGTTNGIPLIPLTGVVFTAPNPFRAGTITTARYFVKVTDNNGEAAELVFDPTDNPFVDGDGEIIVRALGISKTVGEGTGAQRRANSVAIYEARYKRRSTFDLDAPFVVEGNQVLPSGTDMFDGNAFRLDGGANNYGITTIDLDPADGTPLSEQLTAPLLKNQQDNILGMGITPSVGDITGMISADEDKALLLDSAYLYNFAYNVLPLFADSVYHGNQLWSGGSAPYIGYYDVNKSYNHPVQDPKVTIVDGDLEISGNITGGGVLVVTGTLTGSGAFVFNGLVLVIGKGEFDGSGLNVGLNGGLYVVAVTNNNGVVTFGTPTFSIAGNSNIIMNSDAIAMGVSLFPVSLVGWREVTSDLDP